MVFSGVRRVRTSPTPTGPSRSRGLDNITKTLVRVLPDWTLWTASEAHVDESWTAAVENLLNRILQQEPEKPKTRYEKAKIYASEKVSQVQQRLRLV